MLGILDSEAQPYPAISPPTLVDYINIQHIH